MPQRRSFEHNASEAALILFWPVTDGGLWDPEASRMVLSALAFLDGKNLFDSKFYIFWIHMPRKEIYWKFMLLTIL